MVNPIAHATRRRALEMIGALAVVLIGRGTAASADPSSLVFFDQGRSDIGDAGKELIGVIARKIKRTSTVTLEGHCDTSEQAPDKLSLARAQEVQRLLIAAGAKTAAPFKVVGKGATGLRVPTGPNTSEPLNRYVGVFIG